MIADFFDAALTEAAIALILVAPFAVYFLELQVSAS